MDVPELELAELTGALQSLVALPDEHAQSSLLALAEPARRPAQMAPGLVRGRVSWGGAGVA